MLASPLTQGPDLTGWASLFSTSPIAGALSNSSVKENPSTQPYNNTSAILGVSFQGNRLLLTADAGSEALDRISEGWRNLEWMQIPHHGSDGNLSQANIERFRPEFAYVSSSGNSSHPSRAIVSGLITVRSQVFSTHQNHNLWFGMGVAIPVRLWPGGIDERLGESPIPIPPVDWTEVLMKRG